MTLTNVSVLYQSQMSI